MSSTSTVSASEDDDDPLNLCCIVPQERRRRRQTGASCYLLSHTCTPALRQNECVDATLFRDAVAQVPCHLCAHLGDSTDKRDLHDCSGTEQRQLLLGPASHRDLPAAGMNHHSKGLLVACLFDRVARHAWCVGFWYIDSRRRDPSPPEAFASLRRSPEAGVLPPQATCEPLPGCFRRTTCSRLLALKLVLQAKHKQGFIGVLHAVSNFHPHPPPPSS